MKSEHIVLLVSGVGLTIISLLIIFPYLGLYAIEQFEWLRTMPHEMTGFQKSLYLTVFAVMFMGGLGLVAKGITE
jgi:hypothetical protein